MSPKPSEKEGLNPQAPSDCVAPSRTGSLGARMHTHPLEGAVGGSVVLHHSAPLRPFCPDDARTAAVQFGVKKKFKNNLVVDEKEPMPLTYKYHYLDR